MKQGKQIIYVDESSFHRWLVPSKTWVTRDMVVQMPSNRGSSITVIAGISEKQGLVHYLVVNGSNDATTFANFVHGLVRKVHGDAVVYMDNYSVHYSKRVRDFFNDRVKQRFLPAYSCTMNPIEKLWLVVKEKWRRAMIEHERELSEEDCLDLIK